MTRARLLGADLPAPFERDPMKPLERRTGMREAESAASSVRGRPGSAPVPAPAQVDLDALDEEGSELEGDPPAGDAAEVDAPGGVD